MNTEEYILISQKELMNKIPTVKFGQSNYHGTNWYLEFEADNIPMKMFGDIGFQIVIKQEKYELLLWKLNKEIQHFSKTTAENIKKQINILSKELAKSKTGYINKINGQIRLNDDYIITPLTYFNQEIKDQLNPDIRNHKNGYCWYTFRQRIYFNQELIISICTKHHKSISANIRITKYSDEVRNWDTWSKEYEMEILEENEKWLLKEIGHNRYYPWGIITNNYDKKSGFSSINIKYEISDDN